jgi:hypothetical protein
VVRHLAVEAEPTEPTMSEVQVNLFAQPTFRANAVAVSLDALARRAVEAEALPDFELG